MLVIMANQFMYELKMLLNSQTMQSQSVLLNSDAYQ